MPSMRLWNGSPSELGTMPTASGEEQYLMLRIHEMLRLVVQRVEVSRERLQVHFEDMGVDTERDPAPAGGSGEGQVEMDVEETGGTKREAEQPVEELEAEMEHERASDSWFAFDGWCVPISRASFVESWSWTRKGSFFWFGQPFMLWGMVLWTWALLADQRGIEPPAVVCQRRSRTPRYQLGQLQQAPSCLMMSWIQSNFCQNVTTLAWRLG